MDEQQKPQSTKETRREEKEEKKAAERRRVEQKNLVRKIRNWGIVAVIIAGLIYVVYVFAQDSAPQGEDFSSAIPLLAATHVPVGSVLPEYTSNPPSSGPHYAQTARSGFRVQAIPDQNVIHNLEHGDIWIAYHPRVSEDVSEILKKFTAPKVIITPREANDTDIALVAWGRLDTFNIEGDVVPDQRIRDFIKRYVNKGPERVPGASGGI